MLSLNTQDIKWEGIGSHFTFPKTFLSSSAIQADRELCLMGASTGVVNLIMSGNSCIGLLEEMQKVYSLV